LASCALLGGIARAQSVPPLVVSGRVLKVRGADSAGVAGARVVLHRIGMQEQGPVDSVAADRAGRFRFRVAVPDTLSLYVISVRYAGIGYFGAPVRGRAGMAPETALTVYDTTTVGPPLRTALRHLVVGAPEEGGSRRLLDIVQVTNPDVATRVAADSLAPLWWTLVPSGIRDPQVGEGEVGPDAVRFSGDTAFVSAPFPPGRKQIVLTYELPAGERRVALPLASPVENVEILVDDSGAVAGEGVVEERALAIEGRAFRRFVARNAAAGTTVEVRLGSRVRFPARELAIGLAALGLLAGMVLALRRRPRAAAPAPAPATTAGGAEAPDADTLLGRIVALDERYAGREADTPPSEWTRYQVTRAALKAELARRVASPTA
jgi:hypothetical protein